LSVVLIQKTTYKAVRYPDLFRIHDFPFQETRKGYQNGEIIARKGWKPSEVARSTWIE